jgi:hypothetical protein
VDWKAQVLDQLDFHWSAQLRPRLEGLTDEEYLWEPAPDSWSVRDGVIDWAWPAPSPAPVTTIAWRLVHLVVGCFGVRTATHFGGPPMSYDDLSFAATAASALDALDAAYARWHAGVDGLGEAAMAAPCGEAGWEEYPMAALVLHINREVIHHGAEISLLRDLYLRRA